MQTKNIEQSELFITGNSEEEGMKRDPKGWFIGHFVDGLNSLKHTNNLEVKWGRHQENEVKLRSVANHKGTTLTLLISGVFNIVFEDLKTSVILKKPGDYVIFSPGVMHHWRSIKESVVVTVRWPSLPSDQE